MNHIKKAIFINIILFGFVIKASMVFGQNIKYYKNENINAFDSLGKKQGKWIYFKNDDKLSKMESEGIYFNGIEKGVWKYYSYSDVNHIRSIYFRGDGSFYYQFNNKEKVEVNKDSTIIKWTDKRSLKKDDIYIICYKSGGKYIYKRFDLQGYLKYSNSYSQFDEAIDAVLSAR